MIGGLCRLILSPSLQHLLLQMINQTSCSLQDSKFCDTTIQSANVTEDDIDTAESSGDTVKVHVASGIQGWL